MKLRNKKTGEITEANDWNIIQEYNSLAELNEEWEDYEETKNDKMFWIDYDGEVVEETITPFDTGIEQLKQIGNYFETREEAEKAVEKLKAWKRLKDNGFKFVSWKRDERHCGDYTIEAEDFTSCDDCDLDLLFGDEE